MLVKVEQERPSRSLGIADPVLRLTIQVWAELEGKTRSQSTHSPSDHAGQGRAGRTILVIFSLAGLLVPLEL
jgi:hypothetical protein